jgi:hypothetical protein
MPEKFKWTPVVPIATTHRQGPDEMAHALQPALVALQAGQNLPLPALLDALDPRR